jgi:MFS family permease
VLTSAQPRWRGLLFGAVQSAIPVATLLSGVLLAGFHRGGTWRLALWLAVLLTLVSQLLIRRERSFATPTGTVLPQLARIGGRLFVPAMVGIGFLGSAAATSLAVFGASGGVDVGLTAGAAAACQIAGSLCCIAVRISAAWYGGRAAGGRLLNLVALLLVGGTMAFLALAHHHAATFGVGMALAYGCGWGWTGLFNLTLAWARPEQVAQITGMTQMGLFLGSVVGPALFARLVDLHGYALGWLGCGVATSVAVGTAAVLAARVRPAVPCGGEDERRTRVTT